MRPIEPAPPNTPQIWQRAHEPHRARANAAAEGRVVRVGQVLRRHDCGAIREAHGASNGGQSSGDSATGQVARDIAYTPAAPRTRQRRRARTPTARM
eukprot:4944533-Prymnesium_polylepis.2